MKALMKILGCFYFIRISISHSMLKIIYTTSVISRKTTGISYAVFRLCESMIARGLEISLAALDISSISPCPAYLKYFPYGRGPRILGRSPEMKHWLNESTKGGTVDIIHNHNLWRMPSIYSSKIARKYVLPLIVSPHGTMSVAAMKCGSIFKKPFWFLVQRPFLNTTTCFHATAHSEYMDIRRLGFKQPVAVIPNGIDLPNLFPKTQHDFRTLLFLGRIHPIKGLDVLLRAWQAVQGRFSEWRLLVVGPDGGCLAEMQTLSRRLGLKRIEFPGPMYGAEKWKAYSQADLFVLPSYSENFGISIAEALASGVPVVTTKGTPWERLKTYRAGWWGDIGLDPLVACLEDALSQPSENLKKMGEDGRSWMKKEFSWEYIGFQMEETYRWILNGGEKPVWIMAE